MAQVDLMPPPTLSKEPRRSGRRSHPSTSTSKSSGSPSPDTTGAAAQKVLESVSAVRFSSSASARSRRNKDDVDDILDESQTKSISPSGNAKTVSSSKRSQRKGKERLSKLENYIGADDTKRNQGILQDTSTDNVEEDEDAGITRCVCEGRGAHFIILNDSSVSYIVYCVM